MDGFYKMVLIVALVLLVIALIGLGILLQHQDSGKAFPPSQNVCPDGWDVTNVKDTYSDADYQDKTACSYDGKSNLGTNFVDASDTATTNEYLVALSSADVNNDKKSIVFKDSVLLCDKRKWANEHGIVWDGVSNYNEC
jgi:hypothetical protein